MKPKAFANVVEHAGTGLFMPEETARKIDDLSKDLPKDFAYRRLAKAATKFDLNEGERADVSVITTDDVDRDGEVLLPGGLDKTHFNGVVPAFHDYKQLPVAKCQWIKPTADGHGLVAKSFYPPKPADWGDAPWMPSAILHLMQHGVCTAKSVGFLPQNVRSATPQEKAVRPEWDGRPVIDKAALIEYSVVSIPANARAEMLAVSKAVKAGIACGTFKPDEAERIERAMAHFLPDVEPPEPPPSATKTVVAIPAAVPAAETPAEPSPVPEAPEVPAKAADAPAAQETPAGTKAIGEAGNATGGSAVPGDDQPDKMPACPKCMTADKVTAKGDDADGVYQCAMCGGTFGMGDDGKPVMRGAAKAVEPPAPPAPPPEKTAAEKAMEIHAPFVRPATLRKAYARRAEEARALVGPLVRDEIKEAVARALGRV